MWQKKIQWRLKSGQQLGIGAIEKETMIYMWDNQA